VNRGCIPTKALLRSSEIMRLMRRAGEFGLRAENLGVDFRKIIARKDAIVKESVENEAFLPRSGDEARNVLSAWSPPGLPAPSKFVALSGTDTGLFSVSPALPGSIEMSPPAIVIHWSLLLWSTAFWFAGNTGHTKSALAADEKAASTNAAKAAVKTSLFINPPL